MAEGVGLVSGNDFAAELVNLAFDSKFGKAKCFKREPFEDLDHPFFNLDTKEVVALIENQTGLVHQRFKRDGHGMLNHN